MSNQLPSSLYRRNLFIATTVAFCTTGFWFFLTWRWGFDLADEGFYWYGAQRVLQGEIPIRDFMAYDIGRYYWAGAFMHVLGQDGIFAARLSAAVYQALGTAVGVFICLLAFRRQGGIRWLFAIFVACILTLWMTPYYKAYDHASSIFVVGILLIILATNRPKAWLFAGVCLGLVALMGRQHGAYGAVGSVLVMMVIFIRTSSRLNLIRSCSFFALGVAIGFSPNMIMMAGIEGYAIAFINGIFEMFRLGATNISLPVPWPWTVLTTGAGSLHIQKFFIGMGFVSLLAFPLAGILALSVDRPKFHSETRMVLLATIAAAIPYAHYAFARADVAHLALGIFPVLLGVLALDGSTKRLPPTVLASVVLALSLIIVPPKVFKKNWVMTNLPGTQIWMRPEQAERLHSVMAVLQAPSDKMNSFLALPNMPGIHAVFRARVPIWEIYPLVNRDREFEEQEIRRLQASPPDNILLSNHALDGNPEYRYSRTHPLTYEWISSNYAVSDQVKMPGVVVYSLKYKQPY